jgi:UPF0042 nucleotide-binding protein
LTSETPQIVIITGISGAGKSSVLRCFEDMGFFTIDNLPPPLMDKFIEVFYSSGSEIKGVAMVMDVRGGAFFTDTIDVLEKLKNSGYDVKIIFLDAQNDLLIRRFKEARRPHPLGGDEGVIVGLERERAALEELKKIAHTIIDTTNYTMSQLRNRVMSIMSVDEHIFPLRVRIVSFGYKYGVPLDADLLMDVRFLPNPHYDDTLRPFTGNDAVIQEYVMNHPSGNEFIKIFGEFVSFLIPHYIDEGRFSLTIAVGCTGGKHRSVVIALKLSETLSKLGMDANIIHRDIHKD